MGKVVRFPQHHVRASSVASSGVRSPKKSFADKAPPDTLTMRSTSPSEGVWRRVSMRDKEAFDVSTSAARSSKLIPAPSRYDRSGWLLMTACYMERNIVVKPFVAPGATKPPLNRGSIAFMQKTEQGQHFIRQWREKRGISLRKLASRLELEPGGEPLVSYASLSRIETGEQPFSEPILNALAAALDVTRAMLLEMDPEKEGRVVDLLNKMDRPTREQAIRMLELMAQSSAA